MEIGMTTAKYSALQSAHLRSEVLETDFGNWKSQTLSTDLVDGSGAAMCVHSSLAVIFDKKTERQRRKVV